MNWLKYFGKPIQDFSDQELIDVINNKYKMEKETLSFGERAVGLSFNPGGDANVLEIKKLFANIIDFCATKKEIALKNDEFEKVRCYSVAITEAQTAQMWAVKALTWKD